MYHLNATTLVMRPCEHNLYHIEEANWKQRLYRTEEDNWAATIVLRRSTDAVTIVWGGLPINALTDRLSVYFIQEKLLTKLGQ